MSPQSDSKAPIICIPCNNDVLCGRGGEIYARVGNKRYRGWVKERREAYSLTQRKDKKMVFAREVFDLVKGLKPPGRFLQRSDSDPSQWVEITDERALHKTSQALREGAPAIRAKAKQNKQILYGVGASPHWGQMMHPFVPIYPCYGNFHLGPVPIPNYADAALANRLNNVEAMLGQMMHYQTSAHFNAGLNLNFPNPNMLRPQDQRFSFAPTISKESLLKEIEVLGKEVLEVRDTAKRCLELKHTPANKRARVPR